MTDAELNALCKRLKKHLDAIAALRHEVAEAHGVAQACERRAERAEAENAALRRYRTALRSIFFLEHNEREWNSLEEAQEFARIECAAIDAAMREGKE